VASQGENHQCFHGFETLNLASHGVDHALKRPLCSAQPDTGSRFGQRRRARHEYATP
jgi:hypothetical protein